MNIVEAHCRSILNSKIFKMINLRPGIFNSWIHNPDDLHHLTNAIHTGSLSIDNNSIDMVRLIRCESDHIKLCVLVIIVVPLLVFIILKCSLLFSLYCLLLLISELFCSLLNILGSAWYFSLVFLSRSTDRFVFWSFWTSSWHFELKVWLRFVFRIYI